MRRRTCCWYPVRGHCPSRNCTRYSRPRSPGNNTPRPVRQWHPAPPYSLPSIPPRRKCPPRYIRRVRHRPCCSFGYRHHNTSNTSPPRRHHMSVAQNHPPPSRRRLRNTARHCAWCYRLQPPRHRWGLCSPHRHYRAIPPHSRTSHRNIAGHGW